MKSSLVAYILWLFLGFLGVHHFYLKRDRHAFVCWATFGGLFGIGWLRDFFHLSTYVDEANEDEQDARSDGSYIDDTITEHQGLANEAGRRRPRRGKLEISGMRFFGTILMGYIFGTLMLFSCPAEWYEVEKRPYKHLIGLLLHTVPPLGVAVGMYQTLHVLLTFRRP